MSKLKIMLCALFALAINGCALTPESASNKGVSELCVWYLGGNASRSDQVIIGKELRLRGVDVQSNCPYYVNRNDEAMKLGLDLLLNRR